MRSNFKIPEGMYDSPPEQFFARKSAEQRISNLFYKYGYSGVETPLLEYMDTFSRTGTQDGMWKTFDSEGRVLVIRPESTTPIARLVSNNMGETDTPIRLCYSQEIVDYSLGGDTQIGVEMIGEGSPEADAEVIALAIEAMLSVGINNFQIEIGQVEYFKGMMEEAGISTNMAEELRALVEQKNMLAIDMLLRQSDIKKDAHLRIMELPELYGGEEALDKAAKRTSNQRCINAVENIATILDALKDYKLSQWISIDFGMVHAINYYSGVIFKGITGKLGRAMLSGGRYDNLMAEFGAPLPATGFALSMKSLMTALERQDALGMDNGSDIVLLGYDAAARKAAYGKAAQLRGMGKCVKLCYSADIQQLGKMRTGNNTAIYINSEGREAEI